MNRARTRLGVTALGLGGVVFAVIQILDHTIGAFNPRPGISALVAFAVGVTGLTLERARHNVAQRSFLTSVLGQWPLRPAATADPVELGVFPPREPGPYVPRTVDGRVDDALRHGGFVLLVGPKRAGKSRTAYEALRRTLPTSRLVVPAGGRAAAQLLADGSFRPSADATWWLDDLERFLPHLESRDLATLLIGAPTAIATIRDDAWRTLLSSAGDSGDQARRLLVGTTTIPISSELDDDERRAAAELYPTADLRRALGDALAADEDGVCLPTAGAPEPPERPARDPVLLLGLATTAALAGALLAVGLTSGFLTHVPPPIGKQIDRIRSAAERAGRPVARTLTGDLHGFDQTSYVFVLRSPTSGSDELRVYDDVDGTLRRRLDFRPKSGGRSGSSTFVAPKIQQTQAALDYALEDLQVVDVNGDGHGELVADYSLPSYIGVRLPILVEWNDAAQRYDLFPLLPDATPAIGPNARLRPFAGFFHGLFTLDDPADHRTLRSRGVTSFVVVPTVAHAPALLATATQATIRPGGRSAVAVSVYDLQLGRGRPTGDLFCAGGPAIGGTASAELIPAARDPDADYRGLLRRAGPEIARSSGGALTSPDGGGCVGP